MQLNIVVGLVQGLPDTIEVGVYAVGAARCDVIAGYAGGTTQIEGGSH